MGRPRNRDDGIVSQRAPGVLLGLGAIVVCLGLRTSGVLEELELAVHDRFLRARAGYATAPSPVVPVSISEDDFDRFGYPIPDEVLAEALERIVESGAAAIGVDLFREGPASGAPEDLAGWARLEAVVLDEPRVIVSELMPSNAERGIPPPAFAPPAQVGLINLLLDRGRVVRRGYLFAWDEAGAAHTAFSLQLAL